MGINFPFIFTYMCIVPTEYRKNHNRRETARYFMTDENTIDKVLGTKEW